MKEIIYYNNCIALLNYKKIHQMVTICICNNNNNNNKNPINRVVGMFIQKLVRLK